MTLSNTKSVATPLERPSIAGVNDNHGSRETAENHDVGRDMFNGDLGSLAVGSPGPDMFNSEPGNLAFGSPGPNMFNSNPGSLAVGSLRPKAIIPHWTGAVRPFGPVR